MRSQTISATASTTKRISRRRPPRFDLMGGPVCLDFVNTLDDRYSGEPKELLKSYLDLARFAEDTQILSEQQVDQLFARSMKTPVVAERALRLAIEMREAMYAVFWAVVKRKPVPAAQLQVLNQCVQAAAQHLILVPARGQFDWRFDSLLTDFESPLWPIAHSAGELLASDQLEYVRACASKTCEWLFLDKTKNHHRRWCDMTKCGNRAKVKRFYTRNKAVTS
jgi:predicted RNA-binding Zn ribbon-like protein